MLRGKSVSLVVGLVLMVGLVGSARAQKEPPITAEQPVAITAPGQSPEIEMVRIIAERVKLKASVDPLMEAKEIKDYKTLIIMIGGSGKGLGAAGIDVEDEVKRAKELLAESKKLGMKVIGVHIGGEARRGGISARFIDLITPQVNYVIVREDGNKDGIFTKICTENKVPLTIISATGELPDLLKKVFGIK